MRSVTAADSVQRPARVAGVWLCNQLIHILAPRLAGKKSKTNQGIAAEIQKPKLEAPPPLSRTAFLQPAPRPIPAATACRPQCACP